MFLNYKAKRMEKLEKTWEAKKQLIERKDKIQQEKYEIKVRKTRRKLSTSKVTLAYLMIVLTSIQVFTGYVTCRSMEIAGATQQAFDFTPLVALIGACVSEVFSFAVYVYKAAKENTAGGIVYEAALKQKQQQSQEQDCG